jgi:DNA-binding GntR family transcriptional regulator
VTPVTTEDLVEMFETMAEMEAVCGRLATRRMSEGERASLLAAHQACGEAAETGDLELYYERNVQFHRAICMGSHNRFLANEVRQLRRRLRAYRRLQLRVRGRIAGSLAEHQAIVDAIVAGDEDAAEDTLRAHIMIQGERFNDLLMTVGSLQKAGE